MMRQYLKTAFLLSIGIFLITAGLSGEAFAASSGHDSAAHAGEAHHGDDYHEVEGLPQLDHSSYPTQIFWLFVTFTVLYIFFAKKTLPDISGVIENRQEHIQNDLDSAEDVREEAEKVHQAYEEILDEARQKATESVSVIESKIKEDSIKALDEFRDRSGQETQDAEEKIQQAKKEAMKEMDAIAAEIASKAAEKIVGISTDIEQAKSVIENINKKAA